MISEWLKKSRRKTITCFWVNLKNSREKEEKMIQFQYFSIRLSRKVSTWDIIYISIWFLKQRLIFNCKILININSNEPTKNLNTRTKHISKEAYRNDDVSKKKNDDVSCWMHPWKHMLCWTNNDNFSCYLKQ